MTTTSTRTPLTAEEFLDRHGSRGAFELVKGEVVAVSPGMPEHGRVCTKVAFVLEAFGRQAGHGYALTNDTAIVTGRGPDTVRGADVAYYSRERLPEAELRDQPSAKAPDLVVEVVSPSNRPGELREKVAEYLAAGVAMVWVVDPKRRTVAVHRPGQPVPTTLVEAETLEGLPELPGLRCPVADLLP